MLSARDSQLAADESLDAQAVVSPPTQPAVGWCVLVLLLFGISTARFATNKFFERVAEPVQPRFVVNINQASLSELRALPEVGTALAQRIIEYRDVHGDFRSIDDLQSVKGLGPKTVDRLRALLTLGDVNSEESAEAMWLARGNGPTK
ncbi:MAG: helix-hairpin-helix domain-containing protein [Planctomycetales bacterium]|nr:helix-hairpin-helix domain-containing protein [Planctomycetales bacterium]